MLTHEQQLKQLESDFASRARQARQKERDARVEAETYEAAQSKAQDALYEVEKLSKKPA